MNQHIALLCGINVGTAKRVSRKELQALVAELGYTGVRTFLNRANLVFVVPAELKGNAPRQGAEAPGLPNPIVGFPHKGMD